MTILSVAQEVATYVGIDVPDALTTSSDRDHIELVETIREAARMVAFDSGHDWELLKAQATITGDGSTEAFDTPSDFERFVLLNQLWTTRLTSPLRVASDEQEWLDILVTDADYVSGVWILLGGQIQIKPAPEASELVYYYYIKNRIFASSGGTPKANFTADDDTFVLSERLLKLAAVWMWKSQKGLGFQVEFQRFRTALEHEMANNIGRRVLAVGRERVPRGVQIAYPRSLT